MRFISTPLQRDHQLCGCMRSVRQINNRPLFQGLRTDRRNKYRIRKMRNYARHSRYLAFKLITRMLYVNITSLLQIERFYSFHNSRRLIKLYFTSTTSELKLLSIIIPAQTGSRKGSLREFRNYSRAIEII